MVAETAGICHRTGTLMGSSDGSDSGDGSDMLHDDRSVMGSSDGTDGCDMSHDDRSLMGSSDGSDGNTGTLT